MAFDQEATPLSVEDFKKALWRQHVKSAREAIPAINEKIIESKGLNEVESGKFRVIVSGEPQKAVRDEIARIYIMEGGWQDVTHSTSSEDGERSGLTSFVFTLPRE